ncbi:hypothetical protein ACWDE0_21995 [Streptomyces sp. 900105755]
MDKQQAIEAAADAVDVATQAANDYGPNSVQATGARVAAKAKVAAAKRLGATDTDLHNARPQ